MSNEPGGPAPVPDPYAVPDPAPTVPLTPGTPDAAAPSGHEPVAPSGYEAVRTPVGETAPTAPYGVPPVEPSPPSGQQPGAAPSVYAAPSPYGQQQTAPGAQQTPPGAQQYGAPPQYGAPGYGAPQYGAPEHGAPQYGAPQYGAPGYGQAPPPYGAQPYGYGYGQPYVTPPTEGMAIASFVTSTAGLLFLGGLPGPVGLGLGIAALRRIKVNGKAGRGWAIAGIAVGAFGILSMLVIAAYVIFVLALFASAGSSSGFWDEFEQGFEEGYEGGTDNGATGGDASSGLPDFTLRTDLTAGTCLTTFSWEYDMADTEPVDCTVPHEAEVVALVPMSDAVSLDPGDELDAAYNDAWDACDAITESLVPDYFADGNVELYYPHPDDFANGVTSAYCVYYGDDAGMTGSALTGTLQLAGAGA